MAKKLFGVLPRTWWAVGGLERGIVSGVLPIVWRTKDLLARMRMWAALLLLRGLGSQLLVVASPLAGALVDSQAALLLLSVCKRLKRMLLFVMQLRVPEALRKPVATSQAEVCGFGLLQQASSP